MVFTLNLTSCSYSFILFYFLDFNNSNAPILAGFIESQIHNFFKEMEERCTFLYDTKMTYAYKL